MHHVEEALGFCWNTHFQLLVTALILTGGVIASLCLPWFQQDFRPLAPENQDCLMRSNWPLWTEVQTICVKNHTPACVCLEETQTNHLPYYICGSLVILTLVFFMIGVGSALRIWTKCGSAGIRWLPVAFSSATSIIALFIIMFFPISFTSFHYNDTRFSNCLPCRSFSGTGNTTLNGEPGTLKWGPGVGFIIWIAVFVVYSAGSVVHFYLAILRTKRWRRRIKISFPN